MGLTPIASESNPTGAFYELELNATVSAVGSVYTVQLNFIPDPSFTAFMDSRSIGDRRMQIWCKFGNTNVLVFDDQAFTEGAGDEALIMEQNIFVDHSDNTTTSALTELGYEADTEDDLAFMGVTLFKNGDLYNNFTASIVARNTVTGDEFSLMSAFWDDVGGLCGNMLVLLKALLFWLCNWWECGGGSVLCRGYVVAEVRDWSLS